MVLALETFFSDSDKRYLSGDELKTLGRYSLSLPQRLTLYRFLRDQELAMFQAVADQMEAKLPEEAPANLERCLKEGIVALRQGAIAMLVNDAEVLSDQLRWLRASQQNYDSQALDTLMFGLLQRELEQRLSPPQAKLLLPFLQPFQSL